MTSYKCKCCSVCWSYQTEAACLNVYSNDFMNACRAAPKVPQNTFNTGFILSNCVARNLNLTQTNMKAKVRAQRHVTLFSCRHVSSWTLKFNSIKSSEDRIRLKKQGVDGAQDFLFFKDFIYRTLRMSECFSLSETAESEQPCLMIYTDAQETLYRGRMCCCLQLSSEILPSSGHLYSDKTSSTTSLSPSDIQ